MAETPYIQTMEITIRTPLHVKQLAVIFRSLKDILGIVNLHFTEKGMYLQAMDDSHASLVECNIHHSWFDQYKSTSPITIGISCEILSKTITCMAEDQTIRLFMEGGDDQLNIALEEGDSIAKYFSIPLIDIEEEMISVPEAEYDADIDIDSATFRNLIHQLAVFSETLTFNCSEESVELTAVGDFGTMTAKIREEDINEYSVREGLRLSVSYGIKYLEHICAFFKVCSTVTVHCSEEDHMPMKINYMMDPEEKVGDQTSFLRFFLAPKIA